MRIIIYAFIILIVASCKTEKNEAKLSIDHVNIWLDNPEIAKVKLEQIGFTAVPDSLSMIHKGQGTTGRFFYFLNTYLELIYINNEDEFEKNALKNNKLDFIERSNSPENGFLPFSIALKMDDYNKDNIPFEVIPYAQEWMGEANKIYVAKNAKIKKEEPSLFVIYPEIEYDVFESVEALSAIPEEYAIWRAFYKHKNGAEKLSKLKIYTNELDRESETVKALKAFNNVELLEGDQYLMELYFDDQKKNKVYDMRPDIPLVIYL